MRLTTRIEALERTRAERWKAKHCICLTDAIFTLMKKLGKHMAYRAQYTANVRSKVVLSIYPFCSLFIRRTGTFANALQCWRAKQPRRVEP